MDNNQNDEFVYPSELKPMFSEPTQKTVPQKQGAVPAPAPVAKPQPKQDEFVYPKELKSMTEATAVPPAVKPYEGYAGKLGAVLGRGVPFGLTNIAATVPDVLQTGLEYSRYNPLFPSYYGMQPEATGVKPPMKIPGSQEAKEFIEPYVYQPKTKEEAGLASATETGLTGALGIGKVKALPTFARFVTGYGSQATANALADQFPPAALLPAVAMMGGEGFASAVKGLRDSDRIMANKIRQAYELDVRNGKIDPSRVDPNTPILEAAPEGSAVRKLITSESRVASQFPQQIEDFNLRVSDPNKVANLTREASDLFQTVAGRPMGQSSELRDLVTVVDAKDVTKVYDIANQYPAARAINPSIFGGVENLPMVKEVEKAVQNNIANIPNQNIRSQYIIPDPSTGQPGNLAYWDAVYRQLRDEGFTLGKTANTQTAARNSQAAANYIRDALDNYTTVNGTSLYGQARNQAHEHFGSINSLETGNDFYRKTPSSALALQDDMAKFSSLSPEQRTLARYGYIDAMNQDIASNGFTRMADNLADETTPFAQKTKIALAKPELDLRGNPTGRLDYSDYDIVRGKIMKSSIEENLRPVKMADQPAEPGFFARHPNLASAAVAGVPVAVSAAGNALQDFAFMKGFMSPGFLAATAATAALGAGVRMTVSARNNAMKRAANQVLLKLSTGNVRDLQALSQMTREDPFAAAFYKQLQAGLRASQVTGVPEERAAGGRVARASGGRIEILRGVRALMQAAENAKKSISKSTETLLEQPDENIAQALHVAKKNI